MFSVLSARRSTCLPTAYSNSLGYFQANTPSRFRHSGTRRSREPSSSTIKTSRWNLARQVSTDLAKRKRGSAQPQLIDGNGRRKRPSRHSDRPSQRQSAPELMYLASSALY